MLPCIELPILAASVWNTMFFREMLPHYTFMFTKPTFFPGAFGYIAGKPRRDFNAFDFNGFLTKLSYIRRIAKGCGNRLNVIQDFTQWGITNKMLATKMGFNSTRNTVRNKRKFTFSADY